MNLTLCVTSLNKDIRSTEMTNTGGRGDYFDPGGDIRLGRVHDRLLREATNGLCGFDSDGELVMAVDPAKYEGVA